MRARFSGAVARAQIVLGVACIALGAVAGGVLFLVWPALPPGQAGLPHEALLFRALAAVALFAAGLVLGIRLIVAGQLLLVFLDMRRRLARLDRRARRLQHQPPRPESPLTERLRSR